MVPEPRDAHGFARSPAVGSSVGDLISFSPPADPARQPELGDPVAGGRLGPVGAGAGTLGTGFGVLV